MNRTVFVTGTDTDVGKTLISVSILKACAEMGLTTAGFKPVSAGCQQTVEGLRNDDALQLQQASSIVLPYEQVNPIAYKDPVAPHLAAAKSKRPIDPQLLDKSLANLQRYQVDVLLVEGAGGWHLPLNRHQTLSNWVQRQQMDVILVVGLKLGCLNHALLTIESVRHAGLKLIGWVANQIDPQMAYLQDNIDSLAQLIDAPCLGSIPYLTSQAEHNAAKDYLHVDTLQTLFVSP